MFKIRLILLASLLLGKTAGAGIYEDVLDAVKADAVRTLQTLIAKGVDIDTVDPSGNTLVTVAAENGKLTAATFLATHGANLNARNRYGETALMLAASRGHIDIVKLLLAQRAQVNQPGWTALMFAAAAGQLEIARLLIAAGANVNAVSDNGTSALMLAVRESTEDMVRLLLQHRANPNIRNEAGATALGWAMDQGKRQIGELLIKSGTII